MKTPVHRGSQRHVVTPDRRLSLSLAPDTIAEGVRRLGWLALVYAIGNITGRLAPPQGVLALQRGDWLDCMGAANRRDARFGQPEVRDLAFANQVLADCFYLPSRSSTTRPSRLSSGAVLSWSHGHLHARIGGVLVRDMSIVSAHE